MTGTPTFTRLATLYFLGATPLFALLDYAAGSEGPITSPFTPEALANFTLSAGWAVASYTAASRRLTRGH